MSDISNAIAGNSKATETILAKLKAALNADGDFPVRARAVSDLRRLVNEPNTPIEKIVEVILSEPSLGTRVLHLVNSVYYKRNQPILTVSQAVMQLGMYALCDLCSGFVLMQRFSPAAQRGGVFADNVKKCILTSTLTTSLIMELGQSEEAEQGYLAGTFFTIGPLLLAFYFPQVFEAAEKRAQARKQTITQSVTETIGIAPVGLSLGVVDALDIPVFYRAHLEQAYNRFVSNETVSSPKEVREMSNLLATAAQIAEAVIETQSKQHFKKVLDEISQRSGLAPEQIRLVLNRAPESFKQHCKMIEMSFLTLPEHFEQYLSGKEDGEGVEETSDEPEVGEDFSFYLDEIRQAIANRETLSSIIITAMEALAFGQKFDRVLLLYLDETQQALNGKMSLGAPFPVEPKQVNRDLEFLDLENSPDVKALTESAPQIFGDPLFTDGWPFAAVPVGDQDNMIAVIYADMITKPGTATKPLESGVMVALNLITELLTQAAAQNAE